MTILRKGGIKTLNESHEDKCLDILERFFSKIQNYEQHLEPNLNRRRLDQS